jgi:drug/metabolite transporter (DMT)-like permease
MSLNILLAALGANFCFALGSMLFTQYSKKVSVIFMNYFKALIAAGCFFLALSVSDLWVPLDSYCIIRLALSGFIGLCIGDIFLLKAFTHIGPARTLILFGFQPLILGILSYLFLGQSLNLEKMWAILCFILCLGVFSVENFRTHKSWGAVGICFALIGFLLDASGVILTRLSFDHDPSMHSFQANYYRCLGAIAGFLVLSIKYPLKFREGFVLAPIKDKGMLLLATTLGTFLSLSLYLHAIKYGHLATVSALTITGPMFAAIFECIWAKRWPSPYFILAFLFFCLGVYILL